MAEIICPKCKSNQLSVNKKGYSGVKAFAGVLLTGGIGLLAGTIGSNDVIITCLHCGNTFKPGEGKTRFTQTLTSNTDAILETAKMQNKGIDETILDFVNKNQKVYAVRYVQNELKLNYDDSFNYVNEVCKKNGIIVHEKKPESKNVTGIAVFLLLIFLAVMAYIIFF